MLKKIKDVLNDTVGAKTYTPKYKLEEIYEVNREYWVKVIEVGMAPIMLGKRTPKDLYPNDILADDDLTSLFHPLDVRSLTYLGYVNMNAPEFEIIREKTNEGNDRIFIVSVKGKSDCEIKTSYEIQSPNIVKKLNTQDAYRVGELSNQMESKEELELIKKARNKNK
tara:strand:- start:8286 stop:8786 length:501 start_codon:yes stop_codon:yes gene_type:complete